MPRDPKRIKPVLKEIQKAWEKYPDLRLGQLIYALVGDGMVFYAEDDKIMEKAKEWADKKEVV